MKCKIKRKRKNLLKMRYIIFFLIIILLFISTSYSLLSQELYIFGTATGECKEVPLPGVEVVAREGDRLSTNTTIRGGFLNLFPIFSHDGDEMEDNNTVVTKLKNDNKGNFLSSTNEVSVTFKMSITNNSDSMYTDGRVEFTENDPGSYLAPETPKLSLTNVPSGQSTELTCVVKMNAKNNVPVGSYVNYKICFMYKGVERYFNYKIIISG